jgi:hypothetical protein
MLTNRPFVYFVLASFILIIPYGIGLGSQSSHDQIPELDCGECHTCENPTVDAPCLKACPRLFVAQVDKEHSIGEAPDSLLLDVLVNQYGAVRFNHKLHAEMAGMDRGCSQCHHFSPEGKIPPCSQCHGGEANPENLRQPGLKGAYHRHCLSCHREWSHSTACVVFHLPSEAEPLGDEAGAQTDIIGVEHPIITEPVKKVYHTPYESGPVVTFYHKEHIDLFGLRCVDCHQEENCSYCHDLQKPANLQKTDEQIHAICSDCHGKDKCSKCHDTRERPAFSHADTGWPLSRYHIGLDCRACHPTGKRISRLNRNCLNCHGGWNQETFDHAVTGLKLDEIHYELECGDCHIDRQFQNEPSCADCHDDGRSPKENPPGAWIKKASR